MAAIASVATAAAPLTEDTDRIVFGGTGGNFVHNIRTEQTDCKHIVGSGRCALNFLRNASSCRSLHVIGFTGCVPPVQSRCTHKG
jgi:hypothetical protein